MIANTQRAILTAKKAKAEVERLESELTSVEQAKADAKIILDTLERHFKAFPRRVAPALMKANGIHEVHKIMENALDQMILDIRAELGCE